MALTYEPIATTTTNTGTDSISFTSLPTTYTDLRIIFQYPTGFVAGGDWYVTLNNDNTSTNYYSTVPYASASAVPTAQQFHANRWLYFSNAGGMYLTTVLGWVDIPSYQMNTGKPHMVNYGSAQALSAATGTTQWNYGVANNVSAAVTSVQIRKAGGTNFTSTAAVITLFGIKAA
jgi:hypothetical protein